MASAVPATVETYTPVPSWEFASEAASVLAVAAPTPVNLNVPSGIFAVITCVPSFRTQVDNPVARSAVKALNTVEDMTVPVTTGWPLEFMLKTPLENDVNPPPML